MKLFFVGLAAAIFMFVTAGTFFSVAFILLGRFVALLVLLVLSPIGIAGSQIPFADKIASQWWTQLWAQIMVAPAFFVLMMIALNIFKALSAILISSEASWSSFGSSDSNSVAALIPMILMYIIAIALVSMALSTARKFSKGETEFKLDLTPIYDWTTSKPSGFIGRHTAGRAFSYIASFGEKVTDKDGNEIRDKNGRPQYKGGRIMGKIGSSDFIQNKSTSGWDAYGEGKGYKKKPSDYDNLLKGLKTGQKQTSKPTPTTTPPAAPEAPAAKTPPAADGTKTATAGGGVFSELKKIGGLGGKPAAPLTTGPGVPSTIDGQRQQAAQLGAETLGGAAGKPAPQGTPTTGAQPETGLPVTKAPVSAAGAVVAANGNASDAQRKELERVAKAIENSKNTGGGASASAIDKQSLQLVDIATRVGGLAGIEKEEIEEMRRQHEYERRIGRKEYSSKQDKEAAAKEHEKASAGVESIENTVLSRMDTKIGDLNSQLGSRGSGGMDTSQAVQLQSERARLVAERQTFVEARDERRAESRAIVQTLRQEEAPSQVAPAPAPNRSGGTAPPAPRQEGDQRQQPGGNRLPPTPPR